MDLDKIDLPDNHPFAVRKKLAPGEGSLGGHNSGCLLPNRRSALLVKPAPGVHRGAVSGLSHRAVVQSVRPHALIPAVCAVHAVQRRRSCSAAGSARGAACPLRTCASCGSSRPWLTRWAWLGSAAVLIAQSAQPAVA